MKEDAPVEIFNNTTKVVRDDLEQTIRSGSRISVAAACFSIYAYEALKSRLDSCEELRFIFTSPAFVAEKTQKERREFYIPRLKREKSLYGTEFEVRLSNEMKQKAIAKECAEWIITVTATATPMRSTTITTPLFHPVTNRAAAREFCTGKTTTTTVPDGSSPRRSGG